jgi:hypothetical protein
LERSSWRNPIGVLKNGKVNDFNELDIFFVIFVGDLKEDEKISFQL